MANPKGNPDIVEIGKETRLVAGSKQAVEIAKKGGKAKAKAEKRRKTYKEALEVYLKKGDVQEKVILALIDRAIGNEKRPPDVKAIELLLAMTDEAPKEKIEVSTPNTEALENFKKAYYEERDRIRSNAGE